MTITDNIQELLEYLKESATFHKKDASGKNFVEWAQAVEQLQEDLDRSFSISERLQAENEIYRRILDKGITVNVWPSKEEVPYPVAVETVTTFNPHSEYVESEDIDKPNSHCAKTFEEQLLERVDKIPGDTPTSGSAS